MVTSQKMIENEMGYRGSKSEIKSPQPSASFLEQPKQISVKEQRVDGSCFDERLLVVEYKTPTILHQQSKLRSILMGCESSYQVKILSKQLYLSINYSTLTKKPDINPWFITGFSDAEGCFTIKTQYNLNLKTN